MMIFNVLMCCYYRVICTLTMAVCPVHGRTPMSSTQTPWPGTVQCVILNVAVVRHQYYCSLLCGVV